MMCSLLTALACLAVPAHVAGFTVAGDESSGIFTKVISEPPSGSVDPVIFGAVSKNHEGNEEHVPLFYDAQARRRTRNQNNRRLPNQLQLNHHEITTGQITYQKNYQTKRVSSSTPNRLHSVDNQNRNFFIPATNFNRPTSQFLGQQQRISYDRNGNPIRDFTRSVQSTFSNQIISQPNRYSDSRFTPQISGNFQALQNGFQQSANRFENPSANSLGGSFSNSQQIGSTFQRVQTPGSNLNSHQPGSFPFTSTNRRQGNRFVSRPVTVHSNLQFNNRPAQTVGLQNNAWDRHRFSGFSEGQNNGQVLLSSASHGNTPNYSSNRGALSPQQLRSAQYPDFAGAGTAGRWQQSNRRNQITGQYSASAQQFGGRPGGLRQQTFGGNVGYQVPSNSLT